MLEIEWEEGFLSGPAAYSLYFSTLAPSGDPSAPLARLSIAALRYAEALQLQDAGVLARKLYRYNGIPLSPEWRRRFPNAAAVDRILREEIAESPSRASRWTTFLNPGTDRAWRIWERAGARVPAPDAATYKLYVSPAPSAALLSEACRAIRGLAGRRGAPFAFKAGADLQSLLRSDKLVVYYATLDSLLEGAEQLRRRLQGMPGQGVPFTAELDAGALLSWGADPGNAAEPPGPLRQNSWRRWLTARLAGGLVAALTAQVATPPWRYALDRVSLDGVDTVKWIPPAWFFSGGGHVDH